MALCFSISVGTLKIRKTDLKGCKPIPSFFTAPSAVIGGGDNNDPRPVSIDSDLE